MGLAETLSRQLDVELVCPGHIPITSARGLKLRPSPPFPGNTVQSAFFGPLVAAYAIKPLRRILADYDVVLTGWPGNLVAPFAHQRVVYYCYEPYQRLYDEGFVSTLPLRQRLLVGMLRPLYLPLDRNASRRIRAFMTVDSWTAREIRQIYNRSAVVVGTGVDIGFYKKTLDPHLGEVYEKRKVVLCFAKDLHRYTGTDHLIAAIARVARVVPEALLLIVFRSGNRRRYLELMELAKRMGVSKNVEFSGFIDEAKLPAYYTLARVVVIPYFYQNTTMIAKEAMACGTPVIGWLGRAAEDIGESNSGILVPEGSVSGLADAIVRILQDPGLAAEMGKEAHMRALERFTLEKVVSNMMRVIREAYAVGR